MRVYEALGTASVFRQVLENLGGFCGSRLQHLTYDLLLLNLRGYFLGWVPFGLLPSRNCGAQSLCPHLPCFKPTGLAGSPLGEGPWLWLAKHVASLSRKWYHLLDL